MAAIGFISAFYMPGMWQILISTTHKAVIFTDERSYLRAWVTCSRLQRKNHNAGIQTQIRLQIIYFGTLFTVKCQQYVNNFIAIMMDKEIHFNTNASKVKTYNWIPLIRILLLMERGWSDILYLKCCLSKLKMPKYQQKLQQV